MYDYLANRPNNPLIIKPIVNANHCTKYAAETTNIAEGTGV